MYRQSRGSLGRVARGFGLGLALLATGACTPLYRNHGYAPTDEQLAEVSVGVDTRETVIFGKPSGSNQGN